MKAKDQKKRGKNIEGKTVEINNKKYTIEKALGSGGNGHVYLASRSKCGRGSKQKDKFAIKFLTIDKCSEYEKTKRIKRFRKEIGIVCALQKDLDTIIPIYDYPKNFESNTKKLLYVMPKAESYDVSSCSTEKKIEQMIQVGECIQQLHMNGYAHRDIKPSNLLLYNDKVCLSDFGLVWNIKEDVNITEDGDHLGPRITRPPEMESIVSYKDIDYRKSDVFMFAKTIWLVLGGSRNTNFYGENYRKDKHAYIDKKSIKVETAEPLHCLMEEATKYFYDERIDIEQCIYYLKVQLGIIKKTISTHDLNTFKYQEISKENILSIEPDERLYRTEESIFSILKGLCGIVIITFIESGKDMAKCHLIGVSKVKEGQVVFEVEHPFRQRVKVEISLAIDHICYKEDMTLVIHSSNCLVNENDIPSFTCINEALYNFNINKFYLSTGYEIKVDIKK